MTAPTRRPGAFRSVVDMWRHRVSSTPASIAMYERRSGRWVEHTWREADIRVQHLAHGLLTLGIEMRQRLAIVAETSVDWILADMATVTVGAATATIFPTSSDAETVHILLDSGSRFVFCDTMRQAQRLVAFREDVPTLEGIIVFDGHASADGFIRPLSELESAGRGHAEDHPDALEQIELGPDDLATLIYTSGTTGLPKGVMVSHDAWVYEGEAIDRLRLISPADKQLLFLPLAHVFAKVMQIMFIRLGVPTAVDGNPDRLLDTLAETRPTWLAGVPRVFEKARNRILGEVYDRGIVHRLAFRRALNLAKAVRADHRAGRRVSMRRRIQVAAADRWIFSGIRARFGGRIRFMVSGGAPLSVDVAAFFDAIGIVICEGYGLTETAAACVNTPDDLMFGTVGRPLPGCEVRIASDGEILLRSRGVMLGYHNLEEWTDQVLVDGWMRTGDIGVLEPSGHLRITDRKKDLIVTAGGKNVAPALFEERLKARSIHVAQVMVHGDSRNFCSALVTLDYDALERWARDQDIRWTGHRDLAAKPDVLDLIAQAIEDVNRELSSHEQVRRFAVLPDEFTTANGMLTPSLKMKRRAIEERYADTLDGFYRGAVREV